MPSTEDPTTKANPSNSQSPGAEQHRWYASVVSGATAGFVSSVATCPLDVVKTRLQAQRTAFQGEGYLGVVGPYSRRLTPNFHRCR